MFEALGRRTWAVLIGLVVVALAVLAGCGLTAPVGHGVPGALPGSVPPSVSAVASPTPVPSDAPTSAAGSASALSTPGVGPARSAWPSYPPAAEPACAIPGDAPASVAGADGPKLTLKRVARAWRASPAGKSLGVKTGRVQARTTRPGHALPASVLDEPGLGWAELNSLEWNGTRTYVLADQGTAAAKLATIRLMLAQPCSFQSDSSERPLVLTLTVDEPDHVLATGVFGGLPFGQLFIRYGNTVTEVSGVINPDPDEAVATARAALAKA